MHSSYNNPNVRWTLVGGIFSSITFSILWFSTTWLIYALGGSNSDLGFILGIATLTGLGGSLFISFFADKYRRDVLIWLSGGLSLVGSYLLATSNTISQIFIGQIFVSLGSSSTYPIINALFADSITAKNRNRVFGTQFLLSNAAFAIGNFIGYWVFRGMDAEKVETLDVNTIQFSIYIAVGTQIVALLFMLFLRDKHVVTAEEEGTVASNFLNIVEDDKVGIVRKEPSDRFFDRQEFAPGSLKILLFSLISAYLIGLGAGISIPYFPRFFFDIYSINLADLSILFGFMTLITAVWGKLNANLADKYGRVELIVANQLVSVFLLVLLATYPPIIFALLTLIVRNAAMNGVGPVATAIQMEYSPRKYRSKINALNMVSWALLFSIGQIIGGILVDNFGFRLSILITATLYLIATITYWKIKNIASKLD